jgi:hypothetical protein
MPSSRTPKNRVAFLELESSDITADELWEITGFVRCDDCGYAMHTETLVTLPEHRCTQRQALNAAKEAS